MNERASLYVEPYRALLRTNGFEGYRETEVEVIGETVQKFRIKALIGTKLGGRSRWLNKGETALVPKRAIKRMVLALLLLLVSGAQAQTFVSPNCRLTWSAPVGGATPTGYMVYFERQSPFELSNHNAGMNLQFDCAQANLAPGSWRAWVTAYNVVGESAPSNVVPFELVDSAPGSPTGAQIGEIPSQ